MGQGNKVCVGGLLLGLATCNQIAGVEEGTLRECFTVDDCLVEVPECRAVIACRETRCIFQDVPAGTLLKDQKAGDCGDIVCDGAGKAALVARSADVPDDGDPCTLDECLATSPRHTKMTELPCYTGPAETRNTGICSDGIQQCNVEGHPISGCEGEILPGTETCVYPLDEDCDGQSNEEGEGCACIPGDVITCYTGPAGTEGVGICHAGAQACTPDGLGYGPCSGEQTPQKEVCDPVLLDENCDGHSEQDVVCCGDGIISAGETCDDGNTSNGDTCPSDCAGVINVLTAGLHTCVQHHPGQVQCWGPNHVGGLGLGDTNNRGDEPNEMGGNLPPVHLGAGKTAKAIAASWGYTCAILSDNGVKCWGWNDYGQLGLGDTQPRGYGPNQMGDNLLAVDLGSGKTAVAIEAGHRHTCAILDDGRVKCWGYNMYGELGLGDIARRGDDPGEMGDALPAVDLGTAKAAVDIAADKHTCALLNDNSVKCWGYNGYGELGLGDIEQRGDEPNEMGDHLPAVNLGVGKIAVTIAAGEHHTCALLSNSTIKCWGRNSACSLGLGDSNSRGDEPNEMGDTLPTVNLGTGKTAKAIAAGGNRTCAILNDDSAKCWGNWIGCHPADMGDNLPPVNLGTGKTIKAIAVGYWHRCALLHDSASIKCWGTNADGELGLGDTIWRDDTGDSLPAVKLW